MDDERRKQYLARKASRRSRKDKILRKQMRAQKLAREQRECVEIARNAILVQVPDAPLPRPALVLPIKEVGGKIVLDPEASSSPVEREMDVNSSIPVSSPDGSSE